MNAITFATCVFVAEIPSRQGYYERLEILTKENLSSNDDFLDKNETHYTLTEVAQLIAEQKIKMLAKPIHISASTALYLGPDNIIYKGPSHHPETGMERLEKMYA